MFTALQATLAMRNNAGKQAAARAARAADEVRTVAPPLLARFLHAISADAAEFWGPAETLVGVGAIDEGAEAVRGFEFRVVDGDAGEVAFGEFDAGGGAPLIGGVQVEQVETVFGMVVQGACDSVDEIAGGEVVVHMREIGGGTSPA